VNPVRILTKQHPFALAVVMMLALLTRGILPSGWMPSDDHGVLITLCSDGEAVTAWVDGRGKVHKDNPSPSNKGDASCVYAGVGGALDPVTLVVGQFAVAPTEAQVPSVPDFILVGQGLAAPPPPATGPPALI
jgi:hypothetical protein